MCISRHALLYTHRQVKLVLFIKVAFSVVLVSFLMTSLVKGYINYLSAKAQNSACCEILQKLNWHFC